MEALATEDWTALGRLERNCCLLPAFRAGGTCLGAHTSALSTLRLALFAVLGIVRELLVVKKNLFTGCKDKIRATINAGHDSIRKFHGHIPEDGVALEAV